MILLEAHSPYVYNLFYLISLWDENGKWKIIFCCWIFWWWHSRKHEKEKHKNVYKNLSFLIKQHKVWKFFWIVQTTEHIWTFMPHNFPIRILFLTLLSGDMDLFLICLTCNANPFFCCCLSKILTYTNVFVINLMSFIRRLSR